MKLGIILGRDPVLSIAELLSKANFTNMVIDREFFIGDTTTESLLQDVSHFGGMQKLVMIEKESTREEVVDDIAHYAESFCKKNHITEKLLYSVSVYGKQKKYQKEALLKIKNTAKSYIDGKVRFVHKDLQKNIPVPVLKTERLIEKGIDIVVLEKKDQFYIGHTLWVQDIDAYTKRDIEKPYRDMRNGILPPKLAQIMINIATGDSQIEDVVWDPFCGSGILLMEALLDGYNCIGSDINPEMMTQSKGNISWLENTSDLLQNKKSHDLYVQDARNISHIPEVDGQSPTVIATEGYLGKNFLSTPSENDVIHEQNELFELYSHFFHALQDLSFTGNIVITIPVHFPQGGKMIRFQRFFDVLLKHKFEVVPLYTKQEKNTIEQTLQNTSTLTKQGTIIYSREGQFVGREIVKIRKNSR